MSLRVTTAAVLLAGLAACGARADAPETSGGLPPPSRSTATTTAPTGEPVEMPTGLQPTESRARKLIGSDVYGPDNSVIGTVRDLIIEMDGRISAYVVSIGGFLGIGAHRVAVPAAEVKLGEDGRLTVNLTRDQLAAAPEFDFGERAATRSGPMAAPSGASTGPRQP
jgi:sporulation protein YlmC with PRC-barrel domain